MDTQETQWSTKFSDNSFRPVDGDAAKQPKSLKSPDSASREAEPDIVTAGPIDSAENNEVLY